MNVRQEVTARNLLARLALLAVCLAPAACASPLADDNDPRMTYFQPPIVSSQAPEQPLGVYSLMRNTTLVGLARPIPLVPSYNNQGLLIASWNPHPDGVANRPTVVIIHGGHGVGPANFATAMWARDVLGANALVLDSFWSRGVQENWYTGNHLGATARALDIIAAGRWLKNTIGVDPRSTYLIGDSQGGWAVLRALTDEPVFEREMPSLYAAGFSLYPVCKGGNSDLYPRLGPYTIPVIIFTGGLDTATPPGECWSNQPTVFRAAYEHIHYPNGTHAWDIANRGAWRRAVDGECTIALNPLRRFRMCRDDELTNNMRNRIQQFIQTGR